MNKRFLAVAIAVVVVAAVIFQYSSESERVFLEGIREKAESRPNTTVTGISQEDDCLLCGANGCQLLGEPCWKANVTTSEGEGILVFGRGGGILEEQEDSGSGTPPEGQCRRDYTQALDGRSTRYFNTGCANPRPTCGLSEMCGQCGSADDCVSVVQASVGDDLQNTTLNLVSTQYYARYAHEEGRCTIDNTIAVLYEEITSYEDCYGALMEHSDCVEGQCYFI